MHSSVVYFTMKVITEDMIRGKRILEVGSKNVNGSLREFISGLNPASYTGIDVEKGAGVDMVVDAEKMDAELSLPDGGYDVVICTEVMEHVKDWRKAINNIKDKLAPEGFVLISVRGIGMPYHPYPDDYWRYSIEDMAKIFADYDIWALEDDTEYAGVFILAKKRGEPKVDLKKIELFKVTKEYTADNAEKYEEVERARLIYGEPDDVIAEKIAEDDIEDYKSVKKGKK